MDSITANNLKNFPKKAPKNASFSNVALNKSDVGDFHDGYFVMVDVKDTRLPHNRNMRPKNETNTHNRPIQHQRERSPKDFHHSRPDGDNNVSPVRLTSPSHSPTKSTRNSLNSQPVHTDNPHHTPLSPHKPRKAHYEKRAEMPATSLDSGSPPKQKGPSPPKEKGPSPPSVRWAGPAFSNAPPPSSLPLPDFPPFAPQTSPSSSPPSQTPQPTPQYVPQPPPTVYYEPYFYPPVYTHYHPTSFTLPPVPPPSLDQLSMGLRRMLHINEVPPISA